MTVNTTLRVGGAMLVGIALVGGALLLSKKQTAAEYSAAVVVADKPRAYQETRDGDGDGLRDWEEELRGTDPKTPDDLSKKPEPVEEAPVEELPNTMTNQFSKDFFAYYLKHNAGNAAMTQEQKDAFIKQAAAAAEKQVDSKLLTTTDIITSSENNFAVWRDYGNTVAMIMQRYPVKNENELSIFSRAIQSNDPSIIEELGPIEKSYNDTIADLRTLQTPTLFLNEHLNLLNRMISVHNTVIAMQNVFSDPLPALVRTQQYQDEAQQLSNALASMHALLTAQGVTYTSDEPGIFFEAFQP